MPKKSQSPKFAKLNQSDKKGYQPHILKHKMDKYHFEGGVRLINKMVKASTDMTEIAHELDDLEENGFSRNEAYTLKTDKKLYEYSVLALNSIHKIGNLISQANPTIFNTYFDQRNKGDR